MVSSNDYANKLEAVSIVNSRNLSRTKQEFTGEIITKWYKGTPQKETITVSREIKCQNT